MRRGDVVDDTTITVSCTFGAATAAAALAVTNTNVVRLLRPQCLLLGPCHTGAPHATSESGNGVVGHTVHIAVVVLASTASPT